LKRIVFASSSPQLSEKAKSILDELMEKWMHGIDMAEWFRIMFQQLFTRKSLENKKFMDAAIIFALAYPYPQTQSGFNDQVHAISGFDKRDHIHKIMHRTLIMSGKEDILIPPHESRVLCHVGGKSTFVEIDNAAHSIHAENPVVFSELLKKFLVHAK
jgi:pimeloyl-ACP methyl ester carboxylesterase